MSDVVKPSVDTIRAAWQEDDHDFEQVHEDADPSWRHGCYMTTVFKRLSDETFWSVSWQKNGDGEYNSLRDGDCSDGDVMQVWPHTVTTVEYMGVPPRV